MISEHVSLKHVRTIYRMKKTFFHTHYNDGLNNSITCTYRLKIRISIFRIWIPAMPHDFSLPGNDRFEMGNRCFGLPISVWYMSYTLSLYKKQHFECILHTCQLSTNSNWLYQELHRENRHSIICQLRRNLLILPVKVSEGYLNILFIFLVLHQNVLTLLVPLLWGW